MEWLGKRGVCGGGGGGGGVELVWLWVCGECEHNIRGVTVRMW